MTVALVGGEGRAAPPPALMANLLVALAAEQSIRLVEREQVAAVLREQAVSLAAGSDAQGESLIRVGRLLAADLFVFVESEPPGPLNEQRLCRERVVEARTGVVLDERVARAAEAEAQAAAWAAAVRGAAAVSAEPDAQRRYVAVLSFRSEELSGELAPLAGALSGLVEQDLRREAGLIVLERRRVRRLADEKNLTDVDQTLRASTVLIEGGVRRASGKLAVTIRLLSLSGGQAKEVTVEAPWDGKDFNAARAAVSGALVKALGRRAGAAGGPAAGANTGEEALVFAGRAAMLLSGKDAEDAAPLAEAALALAPSPGNRNLAWQAWHALAYDRAASTVAETAEEQRAAVRAAQLELETVRSGIDDYVRRTPGARDVSAPDPQLANWPWHIDTEDPEIRRLAIETLNLRMARAELVQAYYTANPEAIPDAAHELAMAHIVQVELACTGFGDAARLCELAEPHLSEAGRLVASGKIGAAHCMHCGDELLTCFAGPPGRAGVVGPLLGWAAARPDPLTGLAARLGRARATADAKQRDADMARALQIMVLEFPQHAGWSEAFNQTTADDEVSTYRDHVFAALEAATPRGAGVGAGLRELVDQTVREESVGGFTTLLGVIERRARRAPRPGEAATTSDAAREALALLDRPLPPAFETVAEALRRELRPAQLGAMAAGQVAASQPAPASWDGFAAHELEVGEPPFLPAYLLSARPCPQGLVVLWARITQGDYGPNDPGTVPLAAKLIHPDGAETSLGHVEVPGVAMAAGGWGDFASVRLLPAGGLAYASYRGSGLMVFTPGKTRVIGENDGLPSSQVTDLVWLNGRVYLACRGEGRDAGGALARWSPAPEPPEAPESPERGTLEVLASSRAVSQHGPLDGGPAYHIGAMLPDPAHERLWFTVEDGGEARDGVWYFSVPDGRLTRLPIWGVFGGLGWDGPLISLGGRRVLDPATMQDRYRLGSEVGGETPAWPEVFPTDAGDDAPPSPALRACPIPTYAQVLGPCEGGLLVIHRSQGRLWLVTRAGGTAPPPPMGLAPVRNRDAIGAPRPGVKLSDHLRATIASELVDAAYHGNRALVERLLAGGADADSTDGRFRSALERAAISGSTDVARLLIERGAPVNRVGWHNALASAVVSGKAELVTLLLDHGADLKAKTMPNQETPLHAAARRSAALTALLLEHGADVNAVDRGQQTSLHLAVAGRSRAVVAALLAHHADVTMKDGKGRTALDLARAEGEDELARMIEGDGGVK